MKGITEIELTDVRTGEVTRHVEENMFTNALDNLFNRAPWYMNNERYGKIARSTTDNQYNAMAPVIGNAIGGVFLFPQAIEENADVFYAPTNNKPIGMASFDGYIGEDSRQGTFNVIESGPITNGYKLVFDFSTSQANGIISCIALTSKRGGYRGWDERIFQDENTNSQSPTARWRNTKNGCCCIGGDDKGLYFMRFDTNTILTVWRLNTPKRKITLLGDTAELKEIGNVDAMGTCFINGDELWCIRNSKNTTGNATLNIDKYSLDTWEKRTEQMTVSADLAATNQSSPRFTCVSDGYLWLLASNEKSFYKINLNNPADVQKTPDVSASTMANLNGSLCAFNGGVLSRYFYIESDMTVHDLGDLGFIPCVVDGTWVIANSTYMRSDYSAAIGATNITPYLATINNLSSSVTKTANQTAKVTYTVLEA